MGKQTGFLEYPRELPQDRPPTERIKDWDEFHLQLDSEKLRRQGARCMDCGVPFCHTGIVLAGAASGCPINNLIPEWNDLIYRNLWKEALYRLHKTNNFPEFTGRVCPAPCEGACVLGINAPPVTIKNIEWAIIERGFQEGWVRPEPPSRRTGKKVAVVGSGPAGLACAAQLNKAGHEVTVFERSDRIGGLLMYGIPNMKLPKKIVQRRVDLLAQEGIRFVTKTEVGRDYPADRLLKEFDAVVLCGGASKPRDLSIEGRSLKGIHFAMEFLHASTQALLDGQPVAPALSAKGKKVVVIGAGDTGTDCVATAIRQGCEGLIQLEILPRPPNERSPDNPWPQWPKVFQVDYGQEEAAHLLGHDPREYGTMPKRFRGDPEGRICKIETVGVEWVRGDNGRPHPQEIGGTEKVRPAQLVLLAMGFLGPEEALLNRLGLEKGVFVAGDMRRGQSLIVWAIKEGRGAAREVDRYLMGSTSLP